MGLWMWDGTTCCWAIVPARIYAAPFGSICLIAQAFISSASCTTRSAGGCEPDGMSGRATSAMLAGEMKPTTRNVGEYLVNIG
tara:strand:+ start:267 stop:515 length:249 start_codon:yes stop_codon:yes gene_type:complete